MTVDASAREANGIVGDVAVSLRGVTKCFGAVVAVDDVDLDIRDGEFLSMLGPSGSGKTTMLRMIAGFELPTAGTVALHGRDVTKHPPFDRDVNTVFQDYALFPHMTVSRNVAYGLRVKRVPKAERRTRVEAALAMVRLENFGDRRPSQLSGGQRQRIALARALVNRPRVLLLDEPLGALDRKLREELHIELKHNQRVVGITFVFVTHDQEEALTMSDRVAVFNEGRVEQLGAPADIYERPTTAFVAGFVGTSNLLAGDVARGALGREGTFTIRPEKIRIEAPDAPLGPGEQGAAGTIAEVVYLGAGTRYRVDLAAGGTLTVDAQNTTTTSADALTTRGRAVQLVWNRDHVLGVAAPATDVPEHSSGEIPREGGPE